MACRTVLGLYYSEGYIRRTRLGVTEFMPDDYIYLSQIASEDVSLIRPGSRQTRSLPYDYPPEKSYSATSLTVTTMIMLSHT